jgi:hypothetical protein
MDPLLARTSHEAQLYLDLTACSCGETRFDRSSAVVTLPDGDLGRRYTGLCARCGREREFVFRLPREAGSEGDDHIRYGGDEPSQLIDAGEWLWVADSYAGAVPPDPHLLAGPDRRRARARLSGALAAMDEVLKFAPAGNAWVPATAVWTALGRSVYAKEPGRFQVGRLAAVQAAYRGALRQFG